jgi:hypothetical protein
MTDLKHCQCDACKLGNIHDSDCSVHNDDDALPIGPCDCRLASLALPPAAQRPWVGLTPEEVKHLYPYGRSVWGKETYESIEKALKEKNGY